MAEYKKKSVSKRKKGIKNSVTEKIPMQPSVPRPQKSRPTPPKRDPKPVPHKSKMKVQRSKANMKVVKGNKLKIKLRRIKIMAASVLVILALIIVSFALPTGIFEFITNRFASIGRGRSYPHNNTTNGSLVSVVQGNGYYVTVTSGNIDGYNNNGKVLFSYQHGYTYPVVKASSERFVLFSQGDKNYSVYNLSKELYSGIADNNILAMAISRDGTYAVATTSDSYSSQVTVYNKNNKQIYKWMCADYIINNVAISPDGNRIAVSVFNSKAGEYVSRIYVLDYDSATPINLFEYEGQLVLSLENSANNNFYAVFENGVTFYKWRNLESTSITNNKKVFFMRRNKGFSVAVTGIEANKTENEIFVLKGNGKQKTSFNFSDEIVDIAIRGKYIYILSHRKIYIYNVKGEFLDSASCDFGVKRIVPITKFSIATLTDNSINKINV